MHILKVTLRQHTPLIHFQHDQEGATLRASEVKPKLDKFILKRLGNGDYQQGIAKAKTNGWLIGKGEHPALDYKMRIEANEADKEILLDVKKKNDKYITDAFPFLIANMGGKDSEDDLMNLSFYKNMLMNIVTIHKDLCDYLDPVIEAFFAQNNFGQRQTKGFGSFSVISKQENDEVVKNIEWKNHFKEYFENGTPVLKFSLNSKDNSLEKQFMLFSVIDFYWRCLKSGINYSKRKEPKNGVGNVNIKYPERYIKSFLWTYLNSKGYTWEKRKLKIDFGLETPFPIRVTNENSNNSVFARGIMGCPDKYEYRIPQNKFREDRNKHKYKEIVENRTINIENISGEIDRIPSPIIFKPIIDGTNVSVFILFDKELIEQLASLSETKRIFRFSEGRHSTSIPIAPESINYKELIRKFHYYVFTNESFISSTLGEYVGDKWQPAKIVLSKNGEGKIISRRWGNTDISWKMVPRNFRWENILNPSDNGQNHYISFSQIVKQE